MMYFFSAAVLLIFFIDFEVIGMILSKSAENFKANKKKGTAEVVGYDSSEQSRWYSLIVKVKELNDGKTYICNSAKISIHEYPKGSIVDVMYVNTKVLGTQVYLSDKMPADKASMAAVFKKIGFIILVPTMILVVFGVYSVLV